MTTFQKYGAGFNNVGSYQASARPFITASVDVPASGTVGTYFEVTFPKVTRFVTIRNDGLDGDATGTDIRFAFTSGGLGQSDYNYVRLAPSSSYSGDFRVTRLYLMAESSDIAKATVIAGLTQIDANHLPDGWERATGAGPAT